MVKMIKLRRLHSLSTLPNLCQQSTHYRVKQRCSKLLHNTELLSPETL